MFCYKCGIELPTESQFCFSCGAKIISAINIKQNESEENIFQYANEFKIGESTIKFTAEESKEILIRSIFEQNADKSSFFLRSYGHWKIESFEELYDKYLDIYNRLIEQNLTIAVKVLTSQEIYAYNKETILNRAMKNEEVQECLEEYSADMKQVEQRILEFNKDVELRNQDKNPWRGGGFGFSGAIKGMIMAGVLNAGSNAISSLENSIVNSFDRKEILKLKKNLFESEHALHALGDALYCLISAMGEVVYDIMVSEGRAIRNHWWNIDKVNSKQNNIFDLYDEGEIDAETAIRELCDCYQHYPFHIDAKDFFYDIDAILFLDSMALFNFDGNIHYAYRRHFGLEYIYSSIYFDEFVFDEEDKLPQLFEPGNFVEQLKLNNYSSPISKAQWRKDCERYEKISCELLLLKYCLIQIAPILDELSKEHELYDVIYNILDDPNFFFRTVAELMIYQEKNISDAINGVLSFIEKKYKINKLEIFRELAITIPDIYNRIVGNIDELSYEELCSLSARVQNELFGE